MHRNEVEKLIGRPEEYWGPSCFGYQQAGIWMYGKQQEFYFDDDKLGMIDNDYLYFLHKSTVDRLSL